MASARYHGKRARIYLSTGGTSAAVPLQSISGWSFDNTKDKADTTSFEDGLKTSVLGYGNGTITFEGFWDTGDLTLFKAGESTDGARFYGYPSIDAPSLYISARVWVDYSMPNINVSSAVPLRGNLAVKGEFYNSMTA